MSGIETRMLIKTGDTMMILKSNFKYAAPLAGLDDVQLLKTIGVRGILKKENAKAILTRLVNSELLPEGNY